MSETKSNPNNFKVVSFHNVEDFDFTPAMGCMYNGQPINGLKGVGIKAGETIQLPYHIGNQLAINLAKQVLNKSEVATQDAKNIPTGVAVYDEAKLNEAKLKYVKDLYSEEKTAPMSEADKLLRKVEEMKAEMKAELKAEMAAEGGEIVEPTVDKGDVSITDDAPVYQDKQEVIAALEEAGIKHDKRQTKENLEKLLA